MTNQDKTVLVTGGSGFIATHCILKLAAAGYKIKSTVRNLERASELNKILDRAGSTYERLNKIRSKGFGECSITFDEIIQSKFFLYFSSGL